MTNVVNNVKYKIITHKDLDGVGCAVVALHLLRKQYVYVKFVDYNDVNQEVKKALIDEDWNHIFITDISVDKETAELINDRFSYKVSLIDHHPGLDWLNAYKWARVIPGIPNREDTPSGTSLFYDFLIKSLGVSKPSRLSEFVELVRRYDTYIWKNVYNDITPKQLNDYLGMAGFYSFLNEMTERILKNEPIFSDEAKMMLKFKEKEIEIYVRSKNKTLSKRVIEGLVVGFVFADQYHSELGIKLMELNEDLDLVVILDLGRKKISIRSIEEKNVDCTAIAKKWYSGGGHKCASGSRIPDMLDSAVKAILFREYNTFPGQERF